LRKTGFVSTNGADNRYDEIALKNLSETNKRNEPNSSSNDRFDSLWANFTPNLVVSREVGMKTIKAIIDTKPKFPGGSPSVESPAKTYPTVPGIEIIAPTAAEVETAL